MDVRRGRPHSLALAGFQSIHLPIALASLLALACASSPAPAPDDDAEALFRLGWRFETGDGEPRSPERAASYYLRAAQLGHAAAQVRIGYAYETGAGVPPSAKEAARWYERAAEQGDRTGQGNLAVLLEEGRGVEADLPRAVVLYRAAAENGFPQSQTNLGVLYESGRGLPQDGREAALWYERAAAQGEPAGQYNLARMLLSGEHVDQDLERAAALYVASANQGHAPAFHGIGTIHAGGLGVPQDRVEAARWYQEAAKRGSESGTLALGISYASGDGVVKDLNRAERLLREVYGGGSLLKSEAAYRLGDLYENGRDDSATARAWFLESARDGSAQGQYRLGSQLIDGRGGQSNRDEARSWFVKAAAQGHEDARAMLSVLNVIEQRGIRWYSELVSASGRESDGDPADAAVQVRSVLARQVAEDTHDWRLATTRAVLAGLIERHPELAGTDDPEVLYRQAIQGLDGAPGLQRIRLAAALSLLAVRLEGEGRGDEADVLIARAHQVVRETLPPDHELWQAGGPADVLQQEGWIMNVVDADLAFGASESASSQSRRTHAP